MEIKNRLAFVLTKLRIFLVIVALLAPSFSHAYFTDCSRPIILRDVNIENATLDEAIQYLRVKTKLDDTDRVPKGVNIIVMPPLSVIAKSAKITLKLKEAPLADVVKLLARLSQMRVRFEPYAIVFVPNSESGEMFVRTYKVPPDFRSISAK